MRFIALVGIKANTYSAMAEERGSLSRSSGSRGDKLGRYGVYGVTALTGSNFRGVVGDKADSGADFRASSSAANHVYCPVS